MRAFDSGVAALFGKQRGVMCNSGSSRAVPRDRVARTSIPGDEIITPAVTFSTDIAPIVRAGLVPVFVDVEPDTYNIDVDAIEAMIGPRTKAILVPNLIGNVPDWDRIRAIADAHGLQVVEDSCDALGVDAARHADGHPPDISRHELRAVAHHHRGRHGRHGAASTTTSSSTAACSSADGVAAPRCRSTGRRRATKRFFSDDRRRLEYDNLFIFDEVGWNFEPSELSAAFGLVQLRQAPRRTSRVGKRNFALLSRALRAGTRRVRAAAHARRARHGLAHVPVPDPARSPGSGAPSSSSTWSRTGSTRAWCGPATRCASLRSQDRRTASHPAGYPNADRVMEQGLVLPSHHGLTDDDVVYIGETLDAFLVQAGLA